MEDAIVTDRRTEDLAISVTPAGRVGTLPYADPVAEWHRLNIFHQFEILNGADELSVSEVHVPVVDKKVDASLLPRNACPRIPLAQPLSGSSDCSLLVAQLQGQLLCPASTSRGQGYESFSKSRP